MKAEYPYKQTLPIVTKGEFPSPAQLRRDDTVGLLNL